MFLAPPITNTRYTATYLFHSLKSQAKKDSLFAKFLGKNSRLPIFPKGEYLSYTNRKYLGSQDIPIDSIAGTMTENNDYDDKFRPIKDHL